MSYIPAALAIDPVTFVSTIYAAVAAFLTFLIALLTWVECADRVQPIISERANEITKIVD